MFLIGPEKRYVFIVLHNQLIKEGKKVRDKALGFKKELWRALASGGIVEIDTASFLLFHFSMLQS